MLISTFISLLLTFSTFSTDTGKELIAKCNAIKTSIVNQRGFAPGDLKTIESLRDEILAWLEDEGNEDATVLAAELQLNIWLGDNERTAYIFERLAALQPENESVALAWSRFLLAQDDADTVLIFNDLVERFPNSPAIIIEWARALESNNQFTKAIIALERLDEDDLAEPIAAELYGSLLFSDNRFEDSIAAFEAIDNVAFAKDPALSTRVGRLKTRSKDSESKWAEEVIIRETEEVADDLPLAVIETSKGNVEITLFEDHAPNTVANFISLADTDFYNGTGFHRVLAKFMAQGGDPNSRKGAEGQPGQGGPGYKIKDEHTLPDHRKHFAGSLSMAKTAAPNTGGSQFFLTHLPTPHLDGKHTVFGRVTSGLSTIRSIEKDDQIISIKIIRKRDHAYSPEKVSSQVNTTVPKLTPSLKSK